MALAKLVSRIRQISPGNELETCSLCCLWNKLWLKTITGKHAFELESQNFFCKIIQKVCWTLNLSWWLFPSELHSLKVAMIPAPCQTSFLETLANCWPLERLVTLIAVLKKKKKKHWAPWLQDLKSPLCLLQLQSFSRPPFWGWLELFLSVSSYTGGYSAGLFPPNFSARAQVGNRDAKGRVHRQAQHGHVLSGQVWGWAHSFFFPNHGDSVGRSEDPPLRSTLCHFHRTDRAKLADLFQWWR